MLYSIQLSICALLRCLARSLTRPSPHSCAPDVPACPLLQWKFFFGAWRPGNKAYWVSLIGLSLVGIIFMGTLTFFLFSAFLVCVSICFGASICFERNDDVIWSGVFANLLIMLAFNCWAIGTDLFSLIFMCTPSTSHLFYGVAMLLLARASQLLILAEGDPSALPPEQRPFARGKVVSQEWA